MYRNPYPSRNGRVLQDRIEERSLKSQSSISIAPSEQFLEIEVCGGKVLAINPQDECKKKGCCEYGSRYG